MDTDIKSSKFGCCLAGEHYKTNSCIYVLHISPIIIREMKSRKVGLFGANGKFWGKWKWKCEQKRPRLITRFN